MRVTQKKKTADNTSATLKFKIEYMPTREAYRVVLPLYGEAECDIVAPSAADACQTLEAFIYNELEGKELSYGDSSEA